MSKARTRFFDQKKELTNPKHEFAVMAMNGNLNAMKLCWQNLTVTQKEEYLAYLDYDHFAKILQNDHFAEIMEWLKQEFSPNKLDEALYDNYAISTFRNLMRDHHFAAARWLHQNCHDPEITRRMFIFGDCNSIYYASLYGDDAMVDYIMRHFNPDDVDGLFDSRPYTPSSSTGRLAFVQRMYDLTVTHDERFAIDDNGDVDARFRLMVLAAIETNLKSSLQCANTESDILAIWDWHAEKISVTHLQDILKGISSFRPSLFEKALSLGMNACAKWVYTHASDEHRIELDTYLIQSNYAWLYREFQAAAQADVSNDCRKLIS